jgi:hypothetical protein
MKVRCGTCGRLAVSRFKCLFCGKRSLEFAPVAFAPVDYRAECKPRAEMFVLEPSDDRCTWRLDAPRTMRITQLQVVSPAQDSLLFFAAPFQVFKGLPAGAFHCPREVDVTTTMQGARIEAVLSAPCSAVVIDAWVIDPSTDARPIG